MRAATLLFAGLIGALSTPAHALDGDLSAVLGTQPQADDARGLYQREDVDAIVGLRLAVLVHPRIAVLADYDHAGNGARVYAPSGFTDDESSLALAWTTNRVALGARADVELTRAIHPYVGAEVAGVIGRMRADDDPSSRVNPGQYSYSDFAPMGIGMVGLDVGTPRSEYRALGFGGWFEVGYGAGAAFQIAEMGAVQQGGFQVRSGLGLRF